MAIWNILFHPTSDNRNAPFDYIQQIPNEAQQTTIINRLQELARRDIADWPHTWVHKITGDLFQLTVGSHRLLYCLEGKNIVILHAFRKQTQKTPKKEIKRAINNYHRYFSSKRSGK